MMDASLSIARRHLPPALIDSDACDRIESVARVLPAFAVDFFGFECRLGDTSTAADCAMNFTPDGARMLAGRHRVATPPELRGGAWDRLRSFYEAWGDSHPQPYVDAGSTWLEFDTSSGGVPAPNLLFGYWPKEVQTSRPVEWLVDTIIPTLLGAPMSSPFRRNVMRTIEERPAGTEDFQIGLMFARNVQAVRVCVFDIPTEELAPYLQRIGWNGAVDDVLTWVDRLGRHADFIGLHLDVGEVVYPQIGIEPNFVAGCWSRQPPKEPRWSAQFAMLEEQGLLTAAKRAALLDWIGHDSLRIDDRDAVMLRGLSHVKVVLRPGGGAIAKAYFGLAHRILNAPAAAAAS